MPLYHIERVIVETGEMFGDMEHIIYVNGEYQGADEVGKLMHDFRMTNHDEMYFSQLVNRTRYFKENEKGVATMCKAMEDMRTETAQITLFETLLSLLRENEISMEAALKRVNDIDVFKVYLKEHGYVI